MQLKVSAIGGASDGLEISFSQFPVTLGREGDVALRVSDRWASRHHCQLYDDDGRLFIRDLASKHGTYVNGECVDQCELHVGDRVMVGLTVFLVQEINGCCSDTPDILADFGSGAGV